jgi:hypothetical protein
MLIVSAGMQKSGSAYIYNIINDLLIACDGSDARIITKKHNLEHVLRWQNNNIEHLDFKITRRLIKISKNEGAFVVKTHNAPTLAQKFFMALGLSKTIYIYRDPRDVLLSAVDHGNRILANGESHTFAKMVNFNDAFKSIKEWLGVYDSYNSSRRTLMLKYEDLYMYPEEIVGKVCRHLNISPSKDTITAILLKYNKDNPNAILNALHFNKAKVGRYKEEMSIEEQLTFKKELGKEILKMGYEL